MTTLIFDRDHVQKCTPEHPFHQVVHGEAWASLRTLEDGYADCIITDPEYDTKDFNLEELQRVCRGNIVVFCKPENQFFKPDEYLFWVKTPSTKNFSQKCGRFVEMILVKRHGYGGEVSTFNTLHWSQMIGVYDDRLIMPPEHPWEKPLTLIERLVRLYSNPGDLVLDPFYGSGTTLVASKSLGRHSIGFETLHSYVELARKRLWSVK